MQSVSSRIWTRVAVSIFYDENDYTTGTSITNFDSLQETAKSAGTVEYTASQQRGKNSAANIVIGL